MDKTDCLSLHAQFLFYFEPCEIQSKIFHTGGIAHRDPCSVTQQLSINFALPRSSNIVTGMSRTHNLWAPGMCTYVWRHSFPAIQLFYYLNCIVPAKWEWVFYKFLWTFLAIIPTYKLYPHLILCGNKLPSPPPWQHLYTRWGGYNHK